MSQSIENLKAQYNQIKQSGLNKINIKSGDIYPLIEQASNVSMFDVTEVGHSYQKRPVYQIKIGSGPVKIFMWSQMHGSEPTATASLFDLLNYLQSEQGDAWYQSWKNQVTLYLAPMINPDGAEQNMRYNAQGIDINRDAQFFQSPEGVLLNKLADTIEPEFGFNLHDQHRFYSAGASDKTTTISLLAPPFNVDKDINETRKKSMQLIGLINTDLQSQIPGCVGRYDDTYAPRAFGDLFMGKGISTVLFESGHARNDNNRQTARWLTFMLIIRCVDNILAKNYESVSLDIYHSIPMNVNDAFADILLKNVNVAEQFKVDYAINFDAEFNNPRIHEVGDLSPLHGFETRDMSDYRLLESKGYPFDDSIILDDALYLSILRDGYSYFIGDAELLDNRTELPITVQKQPETNGIPQRDGRVHMMFEKENKASLALIDGQWVDF